MQLLEGKQVSPTLSHRSGQSEAQPAVATVSRCGSCSSSHRAFPAPWSREQARVQARRKTRCHVHAFSFQVPAKRPKSRARPAADRPAEIAHSQNTLAFALIILETNTPGPPRREGSPACKTRSPCPHQQDPSRPANRGLLAHAACEPPPAGKLTPFRCSMHMHTNGDSVNRQLACGCSESHFISGFPSSHETMNDIGNRSRVLT